MEIESIVANSALVRAREGKSPLDLNVKHLSDLVGQICSKQQQRVSVSRARCSFVLSRVLVEVIEMQVALSDPPSNSFTKVDGPGRFFFWINEYEKNKLF